MSHSGRKSKGKFVALTYVHSIQKQYVKSHEQHYLTYIQTIDFQMSQNNLETTCPVLVHKLVQYDIHTQICGVEIFVVQLTR